MKRISFFIIMIGLSGVAMAQTKAPVKTDSAKSSVSSYNNIVTAKTISKKGMISIHQNGDKYYFEIPDSILGRELLLTTWLVKVPGGSPKFGGEILNTQTIMFEKDRANKIALKGVRTIFQSDTSNVISKAVRNSNIDAVAFLFDVKARGSDGKTSVVDVSDFLQKENLYTQIPPQVKSAMSLSAMAADRSFVKSFASYPINAEIKMLRTYSAGAPVQLPGRAPVAPLEAAKLGGAITLEISTSILLMPEKPMMARRFDARVGYFADYNIEYTDDQQRVDPKVFIVRYRLEPRAEDME